MGFDKIKIKQISELMILSAILIVLIIYIDKMFIGLNALIKILMPFLVGGAIAFAINIPMSFYERKLFRNNKLIKAKRPICLVLSILSIVLVTIIVIVLVVPQLGKTLASLASTVPVFFDNILEELKVLFAQNPEIISYIENLESSTLNLDEIISKSIEIARNGVLNVLSSTVILASSFIGGLVNFVIAFVFSIYILLQKEKLSLQTDRVLKAYLPKKIYHIVIEVFRRLNQNFRNFITGQCTEAVILGSLFIITMTILKLPYAVMIGALIAFTALIPIVGAFIGCVVGAFLILMVSPIKALIFLILFLTLQQIEGNLIYPKVVGDSVGLPAIWVLAAVTIGGSLMGVSGMLLFIPIVATIYSLLRDDVNKRNKLSNSKKVKTEKV